MEIQELKLEESAQTIAELTERLKQYEADLERKESVSHSINTYKYTYLKLLTRGVWTRVLNKVSTT